MLIRSARRQLQQDAYKNLQPSFEQIHLPWLCPAFHGRKRCFRTPTSTIENKSTLAKRPSQSSITQISFLKPRAKARGLASAAGTIYDTPQDLYIPWDGVSKSYNLPDSHSSWSSGPSNSDLPNWDPSTPIVVKGTLSSPPRMFRGHSGVTGELTEIKQTLHACLQVGRLERAAAMMRRLNKIYNVNAPELIVDHNNYIRELNSRIIRTQDAELLKHVHKWFEVDIRIEGIRPNATTYALMIQASLQEVIPGKLERTVRRYVHMAEEDGMRDEAMAVCLTLLHSQDVGKITRIAPTFPFDIDLSNVADVEQGIAAEEIAEPANVDLLEDLRTTETKGSGMQALRKTLSIFSDMPFNPTVDGMDGTPEERRWAFAMQRQLQLEKDTIASAIDRWRGGMESLKKTGIAGTMAQASVSALMWEWHEALVPKIKEEIRLANEAENHPSYRSHEENERCIYGPFLQYLSAEQLSAVTILTTLTSISIKLRKEPPKLGNIVTSVGDAVHDESLAESINHGSSKIWHRLSPADRQGKLQNLIRRRLPEDSLIKLVGKTANTHQQRSNAGVVGEWSPVIRARVGAVLCMHLFAVAKIGVPRSETLPEDPENGVPAVEAQPVFLHTCKFIKGKRLGVVQLCDAMHDMLNKAPVDGVIAKHLPMVVEPAPWTGYRDGGFFNYKVSVVRIAAKDPQLRRYAETAANNGDMKQVFAGLDILGRTPWNIDRKVFDVMMEAWNTGEAIANLSPDNPQINFPPEPSPDEDITVHRRWARDIRDLKNHKAGLHGQRSFQNLQLEVARAYLKETFYFPHNLDFRGRAYPIAPFLNHMGADNCRGLLRFGKGKELGSRGLTWLKVHLANVFGYDKASFEERKVFAEDHISDVCESVKNPLKGSRWWLKAEDPWQCLAACFELKAALDAPDPEKFVSSLPIHQDGTCNGLQHYAALGGDMLGAKQVNLEPGDRPSDIYTAVAEMVKVEVANEAADGNEVAHLLDGKLTRKVVKQTVMTNVYGVTFTGAKAQVRNVLEDILPDFPNTDEMNYDVASRYIAKKIFKALATIFNGAHDIQYWLGDCAARISDSLGPEQLVWLERQAAGLPDPISYRLKPLNSKLHEAEKTAFRTTVIWTSPLKMPVVQPYRISPVRHITTNLQKISISSISPSDPVSKRKQLQAFPPNFIHSLDATHMLLSALKCDELGLLFAAVHDSFWTHAADVDVMNRIIRDAFIRMHSEDIIGRLAAEFAARYKGHWYLASFSNNTPIARKIISFRKSAPPKERTSATSNKTKFLELLKEKKRFDLLASDDPKLRAEGEAMVTPGSLFLEMANQNDLASVAEVENVGIGPKKTSKRAAKLQTNEQIEVGDVDNATAVEDDFGDQTVFPGAESVSVGDMEDELDEEALLEAAKEEKAKSSKKYPAKCRVWLPLTFPPVPKKGDFDVARLRDSRYFFS